MKKNNIKCTKMTYNVFRCRRRRRVLAHIILNALYTQIYYMYATVFVYNIVHK